MKQLCFGALLEPWFPLFTDIPFLLLPEPSLDADGERPSPDARGLLILKQSKGRFGESRLPVSPLFGMRWASKNF